MYTYTIVKIYKKENIITEQGFLIYKDIENNDLVASCLFISIKIKPREMVEGSE